MTREEMIKALNEIIECPIGLKAWYILALKMAIKELEHGSSEDKKMNNFNKNISKNIAQMFADFVNSFEYDAYEIAMVCSQVLNENNVKFNCAKHPIGIDIFTYTEKKEEENYD